MRMSLVTVLVSLFLNVPAFAGDTQQEASDYERLSQIPGKYEVIGTICEYLATFRLQNQYPTNKFDIEVGIEYRANGRVVGEIDFVVFRKSDKEAVLVGQVKCRKNMTSASHHAHEQNERFFDTMGGSGQHSGNVTFRSTSKADLVVLASQMDEVQDSVTVSQDGGEDHGFDMTIGHDLDTAMDMRDRLLACQGSGHCPAPH